MSKMHLTCPITGCNWQSQELPDTFVDALTSALNMHNKAVHETTVQPNTQAAPQSLKLKSPTVSAGCTPDQWSSFTRQWTMFKTGMAISTSMCATALFYCCDQDLMDDLMRDISGDVSSMSEVDLLAAIKRLAVKEESRLVHRIKLTKMTQAPGTPIRTFLAALRGQASLCQYTAVCKEAGCAHTYDYSDEIILDNLIRGIADPEILADLLGDTNTTRTLDETVAFIAQKEQAKSTRAAVGDSASAMSHPFQRSKPHSQPLSTSTDPKCWACGEARHGKSNDRNTRSKYCEAWSTTCTKCSVKGHYSSKCSKCAACSKWGHRDKTSRFCTHNPRHRNSPKEKNDDALQTKDDEAYTLYDQLCLTESVNSSSSRLCKPVDHHVFEDKWIMRPSKPHPMITVKLTPLPEDHEKIGHPMKNSSPSSIEIPMVADSGCQSSIIPLRSALAMGIAKADIFPVTLSMRGAIEEDLGVEGGIVAEVSTLDVSGAPRLTKQLIYVSSKIGKAFLCREALIGLGVIPASFPAVPVSWPQDSLASAIDQEDSLCSCPQRGQNPPPLPTQLPDGIPATDRGVPALKQWLLEYYASSTFNTCEHQALPMMKCEPLQLHVDPDAKPVAIHKPALVPIHWQEKVFNDLERDVKIGVLEKVSPNTPVTWCSRMVVTAKSDGSPRRTVDLQPQNRHSVRQTHHVQTPFHLADRVPQGTKKTVTDAWNGYHSVPIREEDRHVTTFITPWGRYRYKVAPQGFLASGDAYNQRFDSIIAEFKNKVKCVDDTCMWTNSIKEAFFQTCEWLDLCARNGITLNPKKFQFAQDTVDFAGLTITPTNVKPSSKFLDSITQFPTPKDITGARAWFGLVNQGAYAFSMAKVMRPFRHLLKPSTKFEWTEELDSLFKRSKDMIISQIKDGVRLFQPSRPTCLITDWSISGIGFLLLQKYCGCNKRTPLCCKEGWKLCLAGSRFTHAAEARYAPIEGELLAVVYALHQTRYYIQGCSDLIIATDHKPLVGILNDRPLTEISNRRLLNLKEKTLVYQFEIVHISGKKNAGADAASRYPAATGTPPDTMCASASIADDEAALASISSTLYAVTNMVTWDMVREATASDPLLQRLQNLIQEGFPADCRRMDADLRPYHRISESLYMIDGVTMTGGRIIMPASLRGQILEALHAAHQGVSTMSARATDTVYWPNISIDIQRVRDNCSHCHQIAKSNAMQPPSEITTPEYPFQKICSDYFTHNHHDYVVIVDRYSQWPMVFRSENGADGLVKRLREVFVTFGVPEELTSDGGPQFSSGKTQAFLKSWGVHHRLTSVANPHANSRAEIGVKTVKRMLSDNTSPNGSIDIDKFQKAMLIYRNSIDPETKVSPALILFGRPIRDSIPVPMGKYCPHPTWTETLANREKALAKRHTREREKWEEHTRALPPLCVGDNVYVQNLVGNHPRRWERTGVVVEVKQHHQYVVKFNGSGRLTLRNRQHLRKFTPFCPDRDEVIKSIAPIIRKPCSDNSSHPSEEKITMPSVTPSNPDDPVPTPLAEQENSELETPVVESSQNSEEETSLSPSPSNLPAKVPRALSRLLPYNKPGVSDTAPVGRLRSRRGQQ